MHIGRRRIKGNLYLVLFYIRQQAVHAIGGGLQTHVPGALQPLGRGVDSDHPDRFEDLTALDLVDEVGTDIPRADEGALNFFHEPCSRFADSLAARLAMVSPAMAKFSGLTSMIRMRTCSGRTSRVRTTASVIAAIAAAFCSTVRPSATFNSIIGIVFLPVTYYRVGALHETGRDAAQFLIAGKNMIAPLHRNRC